MRAEVTGSTVLGTAEVVEVNKSILSAVSGGTTTEQPSRDLCHEGVQ